MDERCHNNIQLVSSEAGILYVLERFHEVMGLPLPAEGDHPLFDESRANMLAHSVNLALEKRPSAFDALFAIDGTRLLEACLCIAYPYRNDVWILKMYLRTEGLAVEHAFDELLLDNAGYLFSNVWNLEKKIDQNEIAFLCCNGEMRPFAYSAEDEDFGADRQAAAYVREVLGLEPSLSEWRVRDLVRADDVAELMRHADEKAVREYATHADFCKLFKDGKFELYAFLLGITSWRRLRYAPRDIEKYLVTFCEAEAGAAMDAFLDRYAWNDEDLDRAEDIVSKFSSSCPGNAVASSALVRIRSIIEGRSKERAAERSAATAEAVSLDAGGILRIDGDLFRRNGGNPIRILSRESFHQVSSMRMRDTR